VDCNWFQYQENAADITHTVFLHGARLRSLGIPDASGFFAPFVWYTFGTVPFGLVKAWLYEGRNVGWGNLAVFPNILRIVQEMHWRVPVNGDQTLIFQISGRQMASGPRWSATAGAATGPPLPALSIENPRVYNDQAVDGGRYDLWSFQGQDAAACASQGRIARRERENLAASDFGLVMYRRAWQALCDSGQGPAESYSALKNDSDSLDLRPWLGTGDVTVSRPIDRSIQWAAKPWAEIFSSTFTLVPVPRGSAGRGPLG
jgi:5,5'-dehydrodivanillate O-demethylase